MDEYFLTTIGTAFATIGAIAMWNMLTGVIAVQVGPPVLFVGGTLVAIIGIAKKLDEDSY